MKAALEHVGIKVEALTLQEIFAEMLEKGVLDGLVVPQRVRNTVMYTLVTDKAHLKNVVPFAPVFNVNATTELRRWLVDNKRVGLVAKPCEIHAAIELTKLNQVSKGSILFFSIDCLGTYNNKDYLEYIEEIGEQLSVERLQELSKKGIKIRDACEICEKRLVETGDVVIKHVGLDKIIILGLTEAGSAAVSSIGEVGEIDRGQIEEKQKKIRGEIFDEAKKKRAELSGQLSELKDVRKLVELLDRCVLCKNCRDACPVCYCEDCLFDQSIGRPVGKELLDLAEMRGVVTIPTNVLHYHLTRMYHVSLSCVGCGACQDACPEGIPLTRIFPLVPESVQEEFSYEPGTSLETPQPLRTYQEKEFEPE